MDDNERWRAIRVRASRVELRSTAVDPYCSNSLSNLLSGSSVSIGGRSNINESKLLSGRTSDELQSATMAATDLNVQILLDCRLA
jgi:hypothetical protein